MNTIKAFDETAAQYPTAKLGELLRLVGLPVTGDKAYREHVITFAINNGRRLWPGGGDFEAMAKRAISNFEAALKERPAPPPMPPDKGNPGMLPGAEGLSMLDIVDAGDMVGADPEPVDSIITNFLDVGDKMPFIGGIKTYKSTVIICLSMCIAVGIPFLRFDVPKRRRVLFVNFEIRPHHFHRRLRRAADRLNIQDDVLRGQMKIISARGYDINVDTLPALVQKVADSGFSPEIIVFDPLYKVYGAGHDENSAGDMAEIMRTFDILAQDYNAAVVYVHHDSKMRYQNNVNRGAGSGIIGRDYDAAVYIDPHETERNALVFETVTRNYAPIKPFTARFLDGIFELAPELPAKPETPLSRVKAAKRGPDLTEVAAKIAPDIGGDPVEVNTLKAKLRGAPWSLSRDSANDVVHLLTADPHRMIKTLAAPGKPAMLHPKGTTLTVPAGSVPEASGSVLAKR